MRLAKFGWAALPLALAGCGSPARQAGADAATDNHAAPLTRSVAAPAMKRLTCAEEIGAAAAAERAAVCRAVSPATRPPCNPANSCAMIEDEIARSCALLADDGAAMAGCTPPPKSPQAAAAVVSRYYAAINARDYPTAWAQWGENGRPGQTYETFAAGFADTRSTRVTISALPEGDAGAGSVYQPVTVTVDAVLADGRQQHFTGTYVLRRTNDVDGATLAQRRWHIASATLSRG